MSLPPIRTEYTRWLTALACAGLLAACSRSTAEPTASSSNAQSQNTSPSAPSKNRIAGTWRPLSVRYDPEGKNMEPFGPRPGGLLIFAENGTFVEVLHNPAVPRFAAQTRDGGTPAENAAAVAGSIGIYGTYTVDENGDFASEVVQGSTFPNWNGRTRRRGELTLTVEGDRMIEDLRDPERARVEIIFERVK